MNINSSAFGDGEFIPAKYSRGGGDVSPPLAFGAVPAGTKSLALVCHDPDAPRAEGWTHWVAWNIAPDTSGFDEGSVPAGVAQGTNDWGETSWGGPQPPSGTHRYIFYLYALDNVLDLPASTTRAELAPAMHGHTLASAALTGLFAA